MVHRVRMNLRIAIIPAMQMFQQTLVENRSILPYRGLPCWSQSSMLVASGRFWGLAASSRTKSFYTDAECECSMISRKKAH
jgi:hypothetical protein